MFRSRRVGSPPGASWASSFRASVRSAAMPDEAARDGGDQGSGRHLVLSFDFGKRRIGVACGDTISRTASPLGGVSAGPQGPEWVGIDALIRDWRPAVLVVGLPYNA